MSLIKPFVEISNDDIDLVGGKGLSLGRMSQAGLPIPPGFVITTELHREFMTNGTISSQNIEKLYEAFDKLEAKRVAVRSSATMEDSSTASWAGQFESFMNVERDSFIQKVEECWNSVKGASAYAETQNLKEGDIALAVVVQKMVDSEVSGVAFSVNPLNQDPDEIMIEATYGLGELLVQGMVTPDNYILSKSESEVISKKIVVKTEMLVYKDADTKVVPVDISKQEQPCLSDDLLSYLAAFIYQIEKYYGAPQDIEWALVGDQFFILQSRPITTI